MNAACRPIVVLLALLSGCDPALVDTVMQHDACRDLGEGVMEVDFEQLAPIRGMEFLALDGAEADAGDYRLIAVAAPTQSGRGYGLTLTDAALTAQELALDVSLTPPGRPIPDELDRPAMPCIVIVTTHLDRAVTVRLDGRPWGAVAPRAPG